MKFQFLTVAALLLLCLSRPSLTVAAGHDQGLREHPQEGVSSEQSLRGSGRHDGQDHHRKRAPRPPRNRRWSHDAHKHWDARPHRGHPHRHDRWFVEPWWRCDGKASDHGLWFMSYLILKGIEIHVNSAPRQFELDPGRWDDLDFPDRLEYEEARAAYLRARRELSDLEHSEARLWENWADAHRAYNYALEHRYQRRSLDQRWQRFVAAEEKLQRNLSRQEYLRDRIEWLREWLGYSE